MSIGIVRSPCSVPFRTCPRETTGIINALYNVQAIYQSITSPVTCERSGSPVCSSLKRTCLAMPPPRGLKFFLSSRFSFFLPSLHNLTLQNHVAEEILSHHTCSSQRVPPTTTMSETGSSEEVKSPTAATTTTDFPLKVAATRKGDVILVPQPSDDPEDPLVRISSHATSSPSIHHHHL